MFEYRTGRKMCGREKRLPVSLTAQMSAFARAYHFENSVRPVFCDKYARKLFSDSEYSEIKQFILASGNKIGEFVNTYLAPTPLARARFCTDALKNAMLTGTEQLVILGSGLDMTAFSEDFGGISVFELDRESEINEKKRRLDRAGISIPANVRPIPCSLASESIAQTLERNGFDKNGKTFFSCIGLLYYMTADEISGLFGEIAALSADGSELAFDFGDAHLFSSNVERVRQMRAMAEKCGEPMKSCFGYDELEKLLERHGFLIYEFLNRDEIQQRYFPESELTAFENINFALAVIKK